MRGLFFSPVIAAISIPVLAEECPESGYIEKLVEPEKIEVGFVKSTQVRYLLSEEYLIHKAKYEIMTQNEYAELVEDMTFTTYRWKHPQYSTTPIEPPMDIAKYDIILTPDGNQFHRPLEKPVNRIPLEYHELVAPRYREEEVVTKKRPEPEVLSDGRLKVMISPKHHELLALNSSLSENWREYVKVRTPATYQQVTCKVEN